MPLGAWAVTTVGSRLMVFGPSRAGFAHVGLGSFLGVATFETPGSTEWSSRRAAESRRAAGEPLPLADVHDMVGNNTELSWCMPAIRSLFVLTLKEVPHECDT